MDRIETGWSAFEALGLVADLFELWWLWLPLMIVMVLEWPMGRRRRREATQ